MLKPTVHVQVEGGASVPQQLISEAHHASAPAIALRTGLDVDGGPVWTVRPETEDLLLRPPAVRLQQLQVAGPLYVDAGPAEGGRRFDADGAAPGGGQARL